MKQKFLALCAAAFLFAGCGGDEKTASETSTKDSADAKMETKDDGKKEQAWIPIDSAMSNKAMMDAATLTDTHKMLAKSNGTWTADVTMWEKPGAPPMTSKGSSVTT